MKDKSGSELYIGNGIIHEKYGRGEIIEIVGENCKIEFYLDDEIRTFHEDEIRKCEKILCYEPAIYSGSGLA